MNKYTLLYKGFKDEYHFLSNFYFSRITFSGKTWPTAEHVFQAAKTLNEADRERIRQAKSPLEARKLGKTVELRPDWEAVKFDIMLKIVRLKFKQNPHLAKLLLETSDTPLVELNHWHDNTWGKCTCSKCAKRETPALNALGIILMTVRKEQAQRRR